MAKYRNKPVVIEANRWNPEDNLTEVGAVVGWLQRSGANFQVNVNHSLSIITPEGTVVAEAGDWIIQGVKGFCTCKPDIFEAEYELIKTHCIWVSSRETYLLKLWRTDCGQVFEGLRETCPNCKQRVMLVGFDAWWEARKHYHP